MSDTYQAILDTAKKLFASQGYTATSIREIAEAVGIGKATIYHHFPDKQAILMTLVEGNTTAMGDALQAVRAVGSPRRRFETAAHLAIRFLYDSADLLQVARREVPGAREKMLAGFSEFYGAYTALLEEALRQGMATGEFRPVEAHDTAVVFMTLIQGHFAMAYVTGNRIEPPEKAAERLLDVFFHGICA